MAHKSFSGCCSPAVLRSIFLLMGLCFGGYILGPPLYWHFAENLPSATSCPPCACDCSSEALSIPLGLGNSSFSDCSKQNPDVNEELEKSIADLLAEELRLQEIVSLDNKHRAEASILEAKKTSSQYQKEAEKCNAGMETCEEAREKAEAALIAEQKLSALWEKRARERGWKEKRPALS